MDKLSRWIAAYERMDERRKSECLFFAESQASAHPAKKAVRLVLVHSSAAARVDGDHGSSFGAARRAKGHSLVLGLQGGTV